MYRILLTLFLVFSIAFVANSQELDTTKTITPDVQFIVNPALNNQQNSIFAYGISGRIAL